MVNFGLLAAESYLLVAYMLSRNDSPKSFNVGCSVDPGETEEYGLMVDEMVAKYPASKFIAVGFSMGANIVVKYLGEHEETQSRFIGAVSCCQGYNIVE